LLDSLNADRLSLMQLAFSFSFFNPSFRLLSSAKYMLWANCLRT